MVRRHTRAEASARPRRRDSRSLDVARGAAPAPASSFWPQLRRMCVARWWVFLVFFLLLAGAASASSSERFFVYEAGIAGARHIDAYAIYQAAGVDKQSIFWIDPQRVAEKISKLQGIKGVGVSLSLPASVTIRVEERQPILLWRSYTHGVDWWLDEEGMVLPYHGDPNSPSTVFVVDYSDRLLSAGQRIRPDGLAATVLQLSASLTGVRIFFYDSERGFYFTQHAQTGDWPVYLGDSKDLARKIQVAEVLNQDFAEKNIKPAYLDVRWASRPVYGLEAGASAAGGN
jgi:hypothetical protein